MIPETVRAWLDAVQSEDDIEQTVKDGHQRLHVANTDYQSGSTIRQAEFLHLRSFWEIHDGGMDDFDHLMRDNPKTGYQGYISEDNDKRASQIHENRTSYFQHYCKELKGAKNDFDGLTPHPDSGIWATVRLWQTLTYWHTKEKPDSDTEKPKSNILKKGHKAKFAFSGEDSATQRLRNLHISTPPPSSRRPDPVFGTPVAVSYQMGLQSQGNPSSVDEIYANVSLLLMLQAAISESISFLGNLNWVPRRLPLKLKASAGVGTSRATQELMTAQVDGYLCCRDSNHNFCPNPLAICETKRYVRSNKIEDTQRQETAEMASWIAQCCGSTDGLLQSSASGRKRRLLISQDRHEVYIIIGEYGSEYEEYITGRASLLACATQAGAGADFDVEANARAAAGSGAYVSQLERAGIETESLKLTKLLSKPLPLPPSSGRVTRSRALREPTPPKELPSVDGFLVMHQFGPYIINQEDNVTRFVRRLIALMLQLKSGSGSADGDARFTSQPPPAEFIEKQIPRSWPQHGTQAGPQE